MELLLLSIYGAICWVIFKVFKIPLNKWTLPTAVLGGIVLMFMILLHDELQPSLHQGSADLLLHHADRAGRAGPVIEVPVQPNPPLKKGDVLFRIDPQPYEYALQQKRAALAEAEQIGEAAGRAPRLPRPRPTRSSLRAIAPSSPSSATRRATRARAAGRPLPYAELQVENHAASISPPRPRLPTRRRPPRRRGWPTSPISTASTPRSPGCRPKCSRRATISSKPPSARRPTVMSRSSSCARHDGGAAAAAPRDGVRPCRGPAPYRGVPAERPAAHQCRRSRRGRLRCRSRARLPGAGRPADRCRLAGPAAADRRAAEPGKPRGIRTRAGRDR